VSPHFNADVVRLAKSMGMICIPGVATPSEAFAALDAGADALKLFPAEMMPPAVIKALRAVLPKESILFPVGGISLNNMKDYKAAGASGFGIGTSLYKPGMSGNEVGRQAQAFAQTWGSLR
jgi:2-dehydro-3-deoxyphosphogalactonate aldolase